MLLLYYVLSYYSPVTMWVLFEESSKPLDNKENT